MDIKKAIAKMDAEIQSKHPTGIKLSSELYEELKNRGRIKDEEHTVLGARIGDLSFEMLDKQYYVVVEDFEDGVDYKLSNLSKEDLYRFGNL